MKLSPWKRRSYVIALYVVSLICGMSLRDWFAGMALPSIIQGSVSPIFDDDGKNRGHIVENLHKMILEGPGDPEASPTNCSPCAIFAWVAYGMADAMISARKVEKEVESTPEANQ